jgi:hypothetical protein
VNLVARPAGDQPFRIGDSRLGILDDTASDVLPFSITELCITLRTELDAVNAITPEACICYLFYKEEQVISACFLEF